MAQEKHSNIIWDRDHFSLECVIADCDPARQDLELYDFMERIAPNFEQLEQELQKSGRLEANLARFDKY